MSFFRIPTFMDDPRHLHDVELGLLHPDGTAQAQHPPPRPKRQWEDVATVPIPKEVETSHSQWLLRRRLREMVNAIRFAHDAVLLRQDSAVLTHNSTILDLMDLYDITTVRRRLPIVIVDDWTVQQIEQLTENYARLRASMDKLPKIKGRDILLDKARIARGDEPLRAEAHLARRNPWSLFNLGRGDGDLGSLSARQMRRYGFAGEDEGA